MADCKVSVVCLTYNHRDYIRECLDGFVKQKTTFPFRVVVHDDASTDGTAEIVREYAERYPDIITPILQSENQWSKGKTLSKTFIYPVLRGEYVAFCEGDDYWTDENKLQKQVDFLDSHPDFSICFHAVQVYWQETGLSYEVFPSRALCFNKDVLTLDDLLKHNFIQPNGVLLRWRFYRDSYDLIPDKILPGDWFLFLLHAELGKIKFMPEVMGVYRRHPQGIWYEVRRSQRWFERKAPFMLRFFQAMQDRYGYEQISDIVLMKYGNRLAVEDCDGTSVLRTLNRFILMVFALACVPFAFTRRQKRIWYNYGKALYLSIRWTFQK